MDYLLKEAIEIGYHAPICEMAVEEAGRLLMAAGKVKESYIDGMKEIIRQYGGYCVVAKGLAIPHARPERGVQRKRILSILQAQCCLPALYLPL